ncbi:MAG TPA: cell wall-binding repeat-containing protein [Dermatophilaceae bacterium]|nr:cell wall-binding repeat-containing protein [Dermatophilaceae bacterium]
MRTMLFTTAPRMRTMLITTLAALTATALTLAAPGWAQADGTTHTRLAGADRYSTAVAISQSEGFQPQAPPPAPVQMLGVVVASGADFPDALAAGPFAASAGDLVDYRGTPFLLVPKDGILPPAVRTELTRLNPSFVSIVGGYGAVSRSVETQLKAFGRGLIYRQPGRDRYETAANLVGPGYGGTFFIATGASFPDALGGSAAAGLLQGPLLLTSRDTLTYPTSMAFINGKPAKVVILGGESVIGRAVVSQIQHDAPGATVERWAGVDRYATAAVISSKTYPQGATTAYLASGENYPDALAGGPVAARAGAPLLLTRRDCVPASVLEELTRLGATKIVVLGGVGAVSEAAANLTPCGG